jgi:hypothetical protein
LDYDACITHLVIWKIMNDGFVMQVLQYQLNVHNEWLDYDVGIALPSFLLQIVIENVHTYVIASYWVQIIPLQWQVLQKVNCNNVL